MSALQPQPTDKHASWAWSESRATEDDVVLRARERAAATLDTVHERIGFPTRAGH